MSMRKPSAAQNVAVPPQREARAHAPETLSYLNGRAETMANRYNQRGSSPPTHAAPAVPAFGFSFAPSGPLTSAPSNAQSMQAFRAAQDLQHFNILARDMSAQPPAISVSEQPEPPVEAPTAPKIPVPPPAPKAELAEPPPSAPKAPRALDGENPNSTSGRLQGVRSLEHLNPANPLTGAPNVPRADTFTRPSPTGPKAVSPAPPPPALPTLIQPISPNVQNTRFGELAAPTGPRASRMSPAQASVSPRPPFASPHSDTGMFPGFPGPARRQTPPPTAPSGPRNRSYSASPKVTSSTVPTAPKGNRGPPIAPRAVERGMAAPGRAPDRLVAPPPWAAPSGPRGLQWNQWRRPGAPMYGDKIVPAKRDFTGEEKERQPENAMQRELSQSGPFAEATTTSKPIGDTRLPPDANLSAGMEQSEDAMDVDQPPGEQLKQSRAPGPSAAQSFFGKPAEKMEDEVSMSDAPDEPVSSSEDEADLEQDLALANAKFERQKRDLESRMADLSSREYRATTPLESIARLSRISEIDLQRLREQQEQQENQAMEVDEAPAPIPAQVVENNHLVPPATHSSASEEGPDIFTPKGEEDTGVEIRSDGDGPEPAQRERRKPSPEVISLPYLVKDSQSFHDSDVFQETLRRQQETKAAVLATLQDDAEEEAAADEEAEDGFRDLYRKWREECEDLDREREEQEKLERQQSAEPGPEMDIPTVLPLNPMMEGRRLHKFNSEYEFEQVLKQSEETARLEQERQDRETRKLQADMEKEAKIPDQQNTNSFMRGVFVDANRLRDPVALTLAFSYKPQPDTFTEEEQRIFIAAFKETPKKWGEIASLLPNRTSADCIHHYYANKWDGRFRDNRTRKLKATGRRGRGGKAPLRGRGSALMADLGRAEEIMAAPPVSESGRPKRAAAPTTFGEKEAEAKAAMVNPPPAKKLGLASKPEANGEPGPEKPGKRRRGMGEKSGRKPKAQQPLAALAAAPVAASPKRPFLQTMHSKEDITRAQSLEDASLLAGFQSGHHGVVHPEPQIIYQHHHHHQEPFIPAMPQTEEPGGLKGIGQTPLSKSSASSYWSVPEQTDFAKYIAHFGTDFAAIAAHMGTKTQTMIKNHYQRQIDSGNRPELQHQAVEADKRKEAGEELGPPPTPTPIVKRKYDNPQPTAATPRALAPHTDVMEIDEPAPQPRAAPPPPPKHVSPSQFQTQPRFTGSAQATPIQAHRVVPSPGSATTSPAVSQAQPTAPVRPMQHPLGQRLAFLQETRPESRPGLPATSSFRVSQEHLPRSQPQPAQPSQASPVPEQFIRNLQQEQQRALQMQEQQNQQSQQEHRDQLQRQASLHRASLQGSPATQPLQQPQPERKPLMEERAPTPPRSHFAQSPFARPSFNQAPFGPLTSTQLNASLMGRPPFNPSAPKKEEPRPSSVPAVQPTPPPVSKPAPLPEPPKRSNLMSILNADAEEPKPLKKENTLAAPQRVASPASSAFQSAPTPVPQPSVPPPQRRETFGQPSIPQSQFQRSSLGQSNQTPAPPPQSVKQEPHAGSTPVNQHPKPDWASHVLGRGQSAQVAQSAAAASKEDQRPYFTSHRPSLFGALNQPIRVNPSPPPHTVIGHSRTPSLTTQPNQPQPREQHPGIQAQQHQHGHRGPIQPLHANPYAQQAQQQQQNAGTPFSQPPAQHMHNHAHHAHNSSLGSFPGMHHRAPSREETMRQHDPVRQQQQQEMAARRDREEMEWRRMQEQERHEIDRRRELSQREQFLVQQQRQHQLEQEQLSSRYPRGPPPQNMQAPAFNAPAFGQTRMGGLRDQAQREADLAMQQHQEAAARHEVVRQEVARRQQQQQLEDEDRRRYGFAAMRRDQEEAYARSRQDEAMFPRRTPLGGGFGHPPPPRR